MPKQSIIITNFLGGNAPGRFNGNYENQSDPSSFGFDVTVPQEENSLQRGPGLESITNASYIKDDIGYMKVINRPSGVYCFVMSKDQSALKNKLHKIIVYEGVTSHTVVNTSPWPHELPTYNDGIGMEYYNGELYYASGRYFGVYDLSLTFNNSLDTELGTTALGVDIEHPMVEGNGFLFIGNSNFSANTPSIARYDGVLMQHNYLDLSKMPGIITDLTFGAKSLYIAISGKLGTRFSKASSKLIVWDTVSQSWQDEYVFPEEQIVAVRFINSSLYVWGARGLYMFTGTGFSRVHPLQGGPEQPWAVDVATDGQVWYQGLDFGERTIFKYGTPDSRITPIIQRPIDINYSPQFAGTSGMQWVDKNNLYLGGAIEGSSLRRFSVGGSVFNEGIWRTPMIPFGDNIRVIALKAYFFPLSAGTEFTIGWSKDAGTTLTDLFTVSGTGEVFAEYVPDGVVANQLELFVRHTTGKTPKIKRIEIEYEFQPN